MALPKPEPGLVIHYEYLWRNERLAGAESGRKRRPCAVVLAVTMQDGRVEVTVAPLTHSAPRTPGEGVVVPPAVKRHLGLDSEPSWVIVTDLNVFEWPGAELYKVPKSLGRFDCGYLPPALFRVIRDRLNALTGVEAGAWAG